MGQEIDQLPPTGAGVFGSELWVVAIEVASYQSEVVVAWDCCHCLEDVCYIVAVGVWRSVTGCDKQFLLALLVAYGYSATVEGVFGMFGLFCYWSGDLLYSF